MRPEVGGQSAVVDDHAKLAVAQRKDDDLDDFLMDFFDDGFAGIDCEEQHRDKKYHFVPCQKSSLFSSQDTPPATFTESSNLDILSPNTLCNVDTEAVKDDLPNYNKNRKRSKKNDPSFNNQPTPKLTWVHDKIEFNVRTYHVAVEPILPLAMLRSSIGDLCH
jgi:hypothetical protein